MKILALGTVVLAAIGFAALFGGSGNKDLFYAIPVDQVNRTLDQMALPKEVFGYRVKTSKHARLNASTSLWSLQNDNVEYLRLTATTTADGNGTRVRMDVLAPEKPVSVDIAQGIKASNGFGDYYKAGLAEQIDAKLTNREFSKLHISGDFARLTLGVLPNIRETMDDHAAEYDKRRQDDIDRVYANEK